MEEEVGGEGGGGGEGERVYFVGGGKVDRQ